MKGLVVGDEHGGAGACIGGPWTRSRRWRQECRALPGGGEPATSMVGDNVRYAEAHRDVIARWGRFPHRNAILGRAPHA